MAARASWSRSPPSASSLTSRLMGESREQAFLIAAGGTAGHVLPALAIGQALRDRGGRVTFAGSPDRAEARLVPEAGFELDTFRVSGFPRRPGVQPARGAVRGRGGGGAGGGGARGGGGGRGPRPRPPPAPGGGGPRSFSWGAGATLPARW